MSSDIQSALEQLQLNDYISLVIVTAVSYDYCHTFSQEVNYIWQRPWTWVSTLFLLVRYGGCLSALSLALGGTSFIPGPLESCYIVYLLGNWTWSIFWAGADMVMILRVYAMYNQSRIILALLLVIYMAEVVILIVSSSIYSDSNYGTVTVVQVLDITVCKLTLSIQTWYNAAMIIKFILVTVMCTLVVVQFVRDSLQMHQTTRQWQLNRYMTLLVRDGLLYFHVTFLYGIISMLYVLGKMPQGWFAYLFLVSTDVSVYTLAPRFVMNIRELYVLDTQGRCDIDTGFGLSSGECRAVGGTTIGTIAFVEEGGTGGSDDVGETAPAEKAQSG